MRDLKFDPINRLRALGLRYFLILALALFVLFLHSIPAQATTTTDLPFSARLTNSVGVNVADGTYNVTFRLYSVAIGGTPLWTETQSVQVTGGEFSAYLGSVTPLAGVDFTQPNLYLSFQVGSDPEMTPRYQIGSVPSALNSTELNGLSGAAYYQKDQNETLTGSATFTGGLSVQPAATAGTALLVNGASGYNGNLIGLQVNGTNELTVDQSGNLVAAGNIAAAGTLTVSGDSSIAGNLNVTGSITAGSIVGGSQQTGQYTNTFNPSDPNAAWGIAAQGLPLASTNAGLLSLGDGAFDGTSSDHFTGSASGTLLAANSDASFSGNLLDLQVGGSSKFSASASGTVTTANTLTVTSGNIVVENGGLDVTGDSTLTGTLAVTSTATLSGGLSVSEGLNNNTGGITNAGAISGATTIASSGDLTVGGSAVVTGGLSAASLNTGGALVADLSTLGATSITGTLSTTSTINGATISGGSLSGGSVSGGTLSASAVNGLSLNGGVISAGSWQGSAVGVQYGGTGLNSITTGQIIYGSAANTYSKLNTPGTNGQCIVSSSGLPIWSSCAVAAGGTPSLQAVYGQGNTIELSDASDLAIGLPVTTTTDPSFTVNIESGSTGRFAVENAGSDIFAVNASGTSIQGETVTDGANISGGLNNNTGGITNAGAISGGTTLALSGNATISGTLSGLTGLTVTSGGASITGNSSITGNLNVTGSITGSIADTNLTSNVALLDRTGQTFSGTDTFSNSLATNGISNTGTINGASISGGALSATAVNGLDVASGVISSGSYQGGTVAVGYGGTGGSSFTSNGLLYGNGTAALQVTSAGTSGQLLLANASGVPTFISLSGDASLAADGTLTLASSGVTANTYGSGTQVPVLHVDSKGRVTSVTNTTITGAAPTGVASGDLSGSYPNPTVIQINGTLLGTTATTAGTLLMGTGSSIASVALSGDATISGGGVLTVASGAITGTKLASSTISATNLASGDFSSKITSGTYSINVSGNAATVSNGLYSNVADTVTAPSSSAVALSLYPASAGTGHVLNIYNNAGTPALTSYFDASGLFNGSGAGITAGTIANGSLANNSLTVTAGTGLSGGGSVALGGSVTLNNAGVTSITGTTNQVSASSSTGAVTLSLPQSIATSSSPTFGGLTDTGTGGNALAITGAPTNSATSSLIQVGGSIASGNASSNGGTYIGVNEPISGAGSAADFINLQNNGVSELKVDTSGNLTTNGTLNTATISGGSLSATAVNGLNVASGVISSGTFQGSTVVVGYGGTGGSSFTSNGIVYGNNTSALQVTAAGTSGQLLLAGSSGVPAFVTLSGDASLANDGTLTLANSGVTASTYGSGTQVPVLHVDSKGRVTSVTNTTITGAAPTGSAGGDLSGSYPNPTVIQINGTLLGTTATTAGTLLMGTGSNIASVALSGDAAISGAGVLTVQAGAITGTKLATSTITASNLASGDFSSKITSGTYSINISGNAATVSNGLYANAANIITAPTSSAVALSLYPASGGTGHVLNIYNNAGTPVLSSYFDAAGLFNGSGAGITTGTIANGSLANSSLTVTAGTGLSGGGVVALGGSISLSNAGVTGITGTTNQINASSSTGAVTLSLPQSIASTSSPTFAGLSAGSGTITAGTVNATMALQIGGTNVCTSTGCTAATGSASYIQNGTSLQASSNFNISGNGTIGGALSVTGAIQGGSITDGTATLSSGSLTGVVGLSASGTVQGATLNATSALQLGGTNINTAGTLSNVAYLNQANTFTTNQILSGTGGNELAITGAPVAAANSSLVQIGSAIANSSANGTYLGVNSATSFAGNLVDFQANGSRVFSIGSSGSTKIRPWNFLSVQQTTSAESSFTDVTSIANSSTAWNLFGGTAANQRTYFGFDLSSFTAVNFVATTGLVGPTITWQVCTAASTTCTTWTNISGGADGTSNLSTSGQVSWANAIVKSAVNGTTMYWLRATTSAATITSQATGTFFLSNPGGTTDVALLIQPLAAGNSVWSANGTSIGVNAAPGFNGNLVDLQVNGSSKFKVDASGNITTSGAINGLNVASGVISSATFQGSTIGVAYGGTGAGTFASNGVLYGNGTSALQVTSAGTPAQLLVANASSVPTFVTLSGDGSLSNTGSLTVAKINGTLLGTTATTAGTLLMGTGSSIASVALSGDATISGGGVLTVASGAITGTKLASSTISATNLASGDFSSKITSGTYSINVSGNAATVSNGLYSNVADTVTAPSSSAVALSLYPASAGTGHVLNIYNNAGTPALTSYFDASGLFNGSGAGITAGTIANGSLANNSLTVTAGTGLSGGGSVALGGSVTLNNAGVTSITGTTNQVSASSSTGAVTLSLPQSIATSSSPTFAGLSAGAGTISAATINATTALQLNGTSVNTAGTLSNLAYLNQANSFSVAQTVTSGGLSVTGGINNNSGGLTNTGSVAGATTITASSTIASTATATAFQDTATPSGSTQLVQLGSALGSPSANGTYLGINPTTYTGNFADFQVSGTSKFKVDASGNETAAGNLTISGVGTSTFAGTIQVATITSSGSLALSSASNGNISISPNGSGNTNVTLATGNLNVGDGGTSNFTQISATGALTFNGSGRPYAQLSLLPQDALIPASGGCTVAKTDDATSGLSYDTMNCATGSDQYGTWQFTMPQNYVSGTTMTVDVYWEDVASASTNGARFDVGYTSISSGATYTGATRTDTTGTSVASAGQYKENDSTVTLTAPSINANDLLNLRILRKGSVDTLPDSAEVLQVRVKYLVNS